MQLSELTVRDFADLLGSDAPAPGGGSAAALSGAEGAALTAMVCALTLGRKKYEAFQTLAQAGFLAASEKKAGFLELMQQDTDAFNSFRRAMSLPRETEEERNARKAAMDQASGECTRIPLQVMHMAVETLELTHSLVGKTNRSAVSDLGVAALSLRTALEGAWMNVKINLPGLGDPAAAEEFRRRGDLLVRRGAALAEEILSLVEDAL